MIKEYEISHHSSLIRGNFKFKYDEKKKTFDTHYKGCKNLIDFSVEKKITHF